MWWTSNRFDKLAIYGGTNTFSGDVYGDIWEFDLGKPLSSLLLSLYLSLQHVKVGIGWITRLLYSPLPLYLSISRTRFYLATSLWTQVEGRDFAVRDSFTFDTYPYFNPDTDQVRIIISCGAIGELLTNSLWRVSRIPKEKENGSTESSHGLSNAVKGVLIAFGVVGSVSCIGIAAFMVYFVKRRDRGRITRKRKKIVEMEDANMGMRDQSNRNTASPPGTSRKKTGNRKLQLITDISIKKDIGIGM